MTAPCSSDAEDAVLCLGWRIGGKPGEVVGAISRAGCSEKALRVTGDTGLTSGGEVATGERQWGWAETPGGG